MIIKSLYSLLRLLLLISAALNAKSPSTPAEVRSAAAFARIKTLVGEWQSVGPEANEFHDIYKLDVVVIPTNRPVARKDYNDFIYKTRREKYNAVINEIKKCIAKNQPHLRATLYNADTGELNFDFIDGGNMATGDEGHMHSAKVRFVDDDHFSSEWQYMEGRSSKFKEISQFTRVK